MPYKDLDRRKERAKARYHENPTARQCMLDAQKEYRKSLKGKFSYLKAKAKSRNQEMTITEAEYTAIVESASCEYCNGELPPSSYGLDRVDNELGYTKDNVVPCCSPCNTMKSDKFTYAEMKVAMQAVLEYRINLGP